MTCDSRNSDLRGHGTAADGQQSDDADTLRARLSALKARHEQCADTDSPEAKSPNPAPPAPYSDPFLPPNWIYDEALDIWEYVREVVWCKECGIYMYSPEVFAKNGTTSKTFIDIGNVPMEVRLHKYRCKRCRSIKLQVLKDMYRGQGPEHKITKRLADLIITAVSSSGGRCDYKYVAELLNIPEKLVSSVYRNRRVAPELCDRIDDLDRDNF